MASQKVGATVSRAEVVERLEVIRMSFRRVIETLSNVIVSFWVHFLYVLRATWHFSLAEFFYLTALHGWLSRHK